MQRPGLQQIPGSGLNAKYQPLCWGGGEGTCTAYIKKSDQNPPINEVAWALSLSTLRQKRRIGFKVSG